MKKQSKILSACLTLAIAGTTLVPAVSAADPKKRSSTGKKRPSAATSEKARKRVRFYEPEAFRKKVKERNISVQNSIIDSYEKDIEELDLSEEDREFLCGMINESGDRIFQNLNILIIHPRKISSYNRCLYYLRLYMARTIVCEPKEQWYEVLKKPFDIVFKEKSEVALRKLASNWTSRLTSSADTEDAYAKNYEEIVNELAPYSYVYRNNK